MGKRHTSRKLAMQTLYQAELKNEAIEDVIADYLTESKYLAETVDWAASLVTGVWSNREKLDGVIKDLSIGWDINRINLIDKNLLRLGLYEIAAIGTDPKIVLNEVIEIAKKYSTDESPKFINGIMGNYVEKILPSGKGLTAEDLGLG